jgi:hypothetical protein
MHGVIDDSDSRDFEGTVCLMTLSSRRPAAASIGPRRRALQAARGVRSEHARRRNSTPLFELTY